MSRAATLEGPRATLAAYDVGSGAGDVARRHPRPTAGCDDRAHNQPINQAVNQADFVVRPGRRH